jgi:hypothetical protein
LNELGLKLQVANARIEGDFEPAFASLIRQGPGQYRGNTCSIALLRHLDAFFDDVTDGVVDDRLRCGTDAIARAARAPWIARTEAASLVPPVRI